MLKWNSRNLARVAAMLLASGLAAALFASSRASAFDLAGALRDAAPGQTIRVPAGIYAGPLVIDKPLVLIGEIGAILDGGGRGNVVAIHAADVTLRGFVIRRSGSSLDHEDSGVAVLAPRATVEGNTLEEVLFGIYAKQAPGTVIRGNTVGGQRLDIARRGDGIRLWYSSDCVIDSNRVHDGRDTVVWFSKNVRVLRNDVRRCRYGLHFMYSNNNTVSGNHLVDNSVGTYLMYSRGLTLRGNTFQQNRGSSGYGVGLKDMDDLVAEDNRFIGNRIGIYLDTSPQSVGVYNHFTRNLVAYNDIGVAFLPSVKRNVFHDNTFQDNQEQVAILGSGDFDGNIFAVDGRGNFWSDYKGYDANHDGIGDLPYRSQSFFENLMDREPRLRLFLYSPAQQALELASQAFPVVRPRPKFTDPSPLMAPVPIPGSVTPAGFSWPMAGGGLALFAAAGAVVILARRDTRLTGRQSRGCSLSPLEHDMHVQTNTGSRSAVLAVESLTKRFGRFTAVDDLSFQVHRGEAVALWGTNGAGKTTAIRCILGLIRGDGRVVVDGQPLDRSGKAARARIGYVPQEPGFPGDMSVIDVLRFYARLKGAATGRPEGLLAEVGLAGHEQKRVSELSGGMRKRLALAAALLTDPPLLILDEVAANLDAEARHAFLALLGRLKLRGKTILFTSHRLDEVETLADRMLVLKAGRLHSECTPGQLPAVLGLRCEVKLLIPEAMLEPAIGILRGQGFAAQRNGRGVWVRVEPGRKAAPIHVLARNHIVIDNFEMETQDTEHGHVAD